jgi:hypothetical protein
MADITNVKVGVCDVSFNGTDLGHTLGGVEVTYAPVYHDVVVDKYGQTVVDKYLIGEKLTAKVPLAEKTIANLKAAMPQGQYAGAANARLLIGKSAGTAKASALAAQLVLHPVGEGTRKFDIVLYKAYVASEVTISHKNDETQVIEVEFEALLDETKSDNNYLGLIGDSTA